MNKIKEKPFWFKMLLVYISIVAYCLICFLVAGEDISLKQVSTEDVVSVDNVGELLPNVTIEETLTTEFAQITSIDLEVGTYNRENNGTLVVEVLNENEVLSEVSVPMNELVNGTNTLSFLEPIHVESGKEYTIQISTTGSSEGNAVTVYYGTANSDTVTLSNNGSVLENMELVCNINGKIYDPLGNVLIGVVIVFLVALGIYCIHVLKAEKKGKMTLGMAMMDAFHQYSFLLEQLVSREFKVRYKRSVLGIMWSFVNPLLTMMVQFFVFTLVFKSSIPNYIVYLLIGITFFNFYSESTTGGSLSITSNAALIKKVYVPKYIYPLSQVLSASINFGISLILMVGVSLLSGIFPNVYWLLIPFAIISVFVLNMGVTLILATGMTFFRDVQFIYSVFMTALTYATPMFWDMSMIPEQYYWIFKINPMADIIIFVRDIILNNMYPGTDLVLLMIALPVIFLLIGIHVFKKNQDKFILYI